MAVFKVDLGSDLEFKWEPGSMETSIQGVSGLPHGTITMEVHDKPRLVQNSCGEIKIELACSEYWSVFATSIRRGGNYLGEVACTKKGKNYNLRTKILGREGGNLIVDVNGTVVVGPVSPGVNLYGIITIAGVPFIAKDLFNVEI